MCGISMEMVSIYAARLDKSDERWWVDADPAVGYVPMSKACSRYAIFDPYTASFWRGEIELRRMAHTIPIPEVSTVPEPVEDLPLLV